METSIQQEATSEQVASIPMNASETPDLSQMAKNDKPATSPKGSTDVEHSLAAIKQNLADARNTRDVLVGFRAAVESGTYNGNKMLDLAKGLAFLSAILAQNNAQIHAIQEQINGK